MAGDRDHLAVERTVPRRGRAARVSEQLELREQRQLKIAYVAHALPKTQRYDEVKGDPNARRLRVARERERRDGNALQALRVRGREHRKDDKERYVRRTSDLGGANARSSSTVSQRRETSGQRSAGRPRGRVTPRGETAQPQPQDGGDEILRCFRR